MNLDQNFIILIPSEEESRAVQERLFELGFIWYSDSKLIRDFDRMYREHTGFGVDVWERRFGYGHMRELSNNPLWWDVPRVPASTFLFATDGQTMYMGQTLMLSPRR